MIKEVKYLVENTIKFNPINYDDEEIINNQTITDVLNNPQTLVELQEIVAKRLANNPEVPYLLDIDTSEVTDMSCLFSDIHTNVSGNSFFKKYNIQSKNIKKLDLTELKNLKE